MEHDRATPSPPSDAAEVLGRDPRPVSGAQGSQASQGSQRSQGSEDDSSSESSDNEATDCETPRPGRKLLREELEAVPSSSARAPSPSLAETPKQGFQRTSKCLDSLEPTGNPLDRAIEEGHLRSETPNRPVPELSIRRAALQEDDLESRTESSVETKAQPNKEPEAENKAEAGSKLGAGDSPRARSTSTIVGDRSAEPMTHDAIESTGKLERKSWCARQTSKRAVRAGSAESQGAGKPRVVSPCLPHVVFTDSC